MSGFNPSGPGFGGPPNPFAIRVGNRWMYPDTKGDLHSNLDETLNSNLRNERDLSRGTSGSCNQDPANLPHK
jgi:hypothetical protein